jgi:two-component system, OmpR family, sensor histidine kinase CreC
MKISLKIFLGYFLLVGLAIWFVLTIFIDEVKPGVRQAVEGALVDTAHVLAALAKEDVQAGTVQSGQFARSLAEYRKQGAKANIWGIQKNSADYRVYITDQKGIVIFDSDNQALGQDYSRWNDVYLTLHGKYGVRSSSALPGDTKDTVMYVAAPIMEGNHTIGSLTVAKANRTLLPFIERAQGKMLRWGLLLVLISIGIGTLFTWRLTRAIHRLRDYALAVSQGKKAENPTSSNDELAELAQAMQRMRSELDGKAYVQDAIHQLTHELKSPITAIHAAAELITPKMSANERAHFLDSIKSQSTRLQQMVQNILGLAALEQQQGLSHPTKIELDALVEKQIQALNDKATQRGITLKFDKQCEHTLTGDAFLLEQAINNLLENALDFSPHNSTIEISLGQDQQQTKLSIRDQGTGIPEYALDKIFDKFYSLPRPQFSANAGQKSTGLGLNFVKEVMALHHGSVEVKNAENGGAIAILSF